MGDCSYLHWQCLPYTCLGKRRFQAQGFDVLRPSKGQDSPLHQMDCFRLPGLVPFSQQNFELNSKTNSSGRRKSSRVKEVGSFPKTRD